MKKILIVNNNMKVGGVQKSLCNLLWAIEKQYDVTLLLFSCTGAYMDQVPPGVKVIECKSWFRYLGVSQRECRSRPADAVLRAFLVGICRVFGLHAVLKLIVASQKQLEETYDCAISFLHNGRRRYFYGGVQAFVRCCVKARKKVAFLHCDYRNCGANYPKNNRELENFDVIAACSDGCREAFLEVLPAFEDKCAVIRNCHRFEDIWKMAREDSVAYDTDRYNLVVVSRLGPEKGVERAIKAVSYCFEKGVSVRLHIVGSGVMEPSLKALAAELNMNECVRFYGEQENPYRYMKNADLLLMTSYHEAAPMVIDEARCLGVPVLTVKTTSSEDMVLRPRCGWVCENDQQALDHALEEILTDAQILKEARERLTGRFMDNTEALAQFAGIIEG